MHVLNADLPLRRLTSRVVQIASDDSPASETGRRLRVNATVEFVMSTPISAMITSAVRWLIPRIVAVEAERSRRRTEHEQQSQHLSHGAPLSVIPVFLTGSVTGSQ